MKLKCLSVRQPYACAILTGQKVEEYRSWPTAYRGPLAIHAAQNLVRDAFADFPNFQADRVPRGVILGVVEVIDCVEGGDGWAWLLASPRWLAEPVACSGRLGLFTVELPDHLLSMS